MELQWLLIAQAIKLHSDGLLDIAGIFRRATVSRERLAPSMAVVPTVRFDPLLASEQTTFVLRLAKVG